MRASLFGEPLTTMGLQPFLLVSTGSVCLRLVVGLNSSPFLFSSTKTCIWVRVKIGGPKTLCLCLLVSL